jgi:hypothetical protein
MKTEIKRYLITILLCFILIGTMPTLTVQAAEKPTTDDPSAIIEYILESGDTEYLLEHQDLFPTTMINELLKAAPTNWELMFKDEDAKMNWYVSPDNCLNTYNGTFYGPSGYETFYNLPMDGVIYYMRELGYSEEDYPYWVRSDGVKMFGPYVMVAASLDIRPKGTILPCSLGEAMVVDTGTFASSNQTQLDVAVNW